MTSPTCYLSRPPTCSKLRMLDTKRSTIIAVIHFSLTHFPIPQPTSSSKIHASLSASAFLDISIATRPLRLSCRPVPPPLWAASPSHRPASWGPWRRPAAGPGCTTARRAARLPRMRRRMREESSSSAGGAHQPVVGSRERPAPAAAATARNTGCLINTARAAARPMKRRDVPSAGRALGVTPQRRSQMSPDGVTMQDSDIPGSSLSHTEPGGSASFWRHAGTLGL